MSCLNFQCQFAISIGSIGSIGKSYLSQNKWEKSYPSKGLYIYDNHSIGGGMFLKFVTCFQILLFLKNWSIVHFLQAVMLGVKKLVIFCEFHKWMTPNLSGWMNLAVKQDPRDHDPGHPRIQNMDLYPKVQTNRLLNFNMLYNVNVRLNKLLYRKCL